MLPVYEDIDPNERRVCWVWDGMMNLVCFGFLRSDPRYAKWNIYHLSILGKVVDDFYQPYSNWLYTGEGGAVHQIDA